MIDTLIPGSGQRFANHLTYASGLFDPKGGAAPVTHKQYAEWREVQEMRRRAFTVRDDRRWDVAQAEERRLRGRIGIDIVGAAGPNGPDLAAYPTILLLSVLEHAPDPFAAFGWTAAHLAPGGRLLVAVPYCWGYHEFPGDYWRILPDGLRLLFARHDLTEEEMVMSGERMDETGQVFAVGRRA